MPDYTAGKARILLEPTARGFFTKAKAGIRTEMTGKDLSVPVKLSPDDTGFRTKADEKLRNVRNLGVKVALRADLETGFRENAKRKVDTSLSGLRSDITIRASLDTTLATNQMRAWRAREEARPIRIKVITDTPILGGANQSQRSGPGNTPLAGRNASRITPTIDQSAVDQGVRQIGDKIKGAGRGAKIKPTIDDNDFAATLRRMQRQLGDAFRPRRTIGPSLRGVELLRPGVLSLASQGLPALTVALGEVTGAITQMSGAALAVPGALAVVGASVATLAIGLSGMGAALKALQQEQDRTSNQATADASRFAASQNNMRNSLVDVQRAQQDLTKARKDARRELEDLHAEERSSYLSVAEAALDLQEARNELAKGAFDGPLDRDRAVIRELRARESLGDALKRQKRDREDVNEADRKGVEGSDAVRNAQEALVRSNQQVAETLRSIQQESTGAASAHDKVIAALGQISPSTREAVLAIDDLRTRGFRQLRNTVSENIFKDFARNLHALVDADMPLVTRGLSGIGTGINRNITQLMASLRTPNSQGILERIFGNTEEFHKRLNAAIDPSIRAIGRLAAAGSDAMPRLATGFGRLMDRFADFIEKADREGRLDQWINQGIEGVESLARSFGNIIKTIHSIGDAFGGGLLQTIENVTRQVSDFFASGHGQSVLRDLIREVRKDFEDWKPILHDIPRIMKAAMDGGRDAMHVILPIINTITSLVAAFPGLAGAAFAAFIGWRALTPIFTVVATGIHGIELALSRIPGVTAVPKKAIKSMGDEAALMSGSFATAERSSSGSISRLGTTIAQRGTSAIRGMTTALSATASFLGGPWGLAIGAAIIALAPLIQSHNDAAEAADAQKDALDRLATSLETVSGLAGAATRAQVAQEIQDYQPQQGIHGSVAQAAQLLGLKPDAVINAVMPGAQQGANQAGLNDQLREQLRGPVLDAIYARGTVAGANDRIKRAVNDAGMSDDDVLDAFLGDPAALARFRGLRPTGVKVPDLGEAARAIEGNPQLQAAGLVLQYVNAKAPQVATAQQRGQAAAQTTAGGVAKLNDAGTRFFGQWNSNAQPSSDGTQTTVRVNGPIPPGIEANLKERGDSIEPAGPGQFTITLTEDDAKQLTFLQPFRTGGPIPSDQQYSDYGGPGVASFPFDTGQYILDMYGGKNTQGQFIAPKVPMSNRDGGPTPRTPGRGPTGGHIIEAHEDEWVLPKHARNALGDEWLWNVTKGRGARMGEMPAYQGGGPVPPKPPPPPEPTGVDPVIGAAGTGGGALPGPPGAATPDAPAVPVAQVGVSHAGGPGVEPGSADDPATQLLTQPAPTVDDQGNLVSPQQQTPDIGTAFQDMFLKPWGYKTGKDGQPVPVGGQGQSGSTDPGKWLGEWGANFASSFGETLINGVLGFFGLSTNNVYFNALKQTLGFYSGKLGASQDQAVDPATQSLVNSSVEGYTQLTDPSTGTVYLVPNDSAGGIDPGAGGGGTPLPEGFGPGVTGPIPIDTAHPDATKVKYLADLARQAGLRVGSGSGTSPEVNAIAGAAPHDNDGKLHSFNEALDIGNGTDDVAFAKWWISDPARVASTKELILHVPGWDDKNNIKNGKFISEYGGGVYDPGTLGQHSDHMHLAIGSIPTGGYDPNSQQLPTLASPGRGDDAVPPPADTPPADSGIPPLQIPGGPAAPAPGAGPNFDPQAAGRVSGIPTGWSNVNAPWAKAWLLAPRNMNLRGTGAPAGWYWETADPHAPVDPSGKVASVLTRVGEGPGTPGYNAIWSGRGQAPATPAAGATGPLAPFLDFLGGRPGGPATPSGNNPLLNPVIAASGGPQNVTGVDNWNSYLGGRGPAGGDGASLPGLPTMLPGGGMSGGRPIPGRSIVILPRRSTRAMYTPRGIGGPASGAKADVAKFIYKMARSKGYTKKEAVAIVAYAQGESGLNPGISGGVQGAGGGGGTVGADEVIGLFQEKAGFAKAGGIDPAARGTAEGNVTAYLNQLVRHRGAGDIYDQLLATSVGGPMYTGGRGAMAGLEKQVLPLLAGVSYDRGGLLRRGATITRNQTPHDELIMTQPDAVAAKKIIDRTGVVQPPKPPPHMDVPDAIKKAQPPPDAAPAAPRPTPPPPPAAPPAPPPAAPAAPQPSQPTGAMAPITPPSTDTQHLLPAISKGITSGAAAIGSAANTAASLASFGAAGLGGGGMGGLSIGGAIQQGGKIVEGIANVAATFASGFTKFGGTTPNPYGVQQRRKDEAPPLAQDNRRVHQGDNYFASMDEWRRQNQLQDAQDMQAGLARVR